MVITKVLENFLRNRHICSEFIFLITRSVKNSSYIKTKLMTTLIYSMILRSESAPAVEF